MGNDIVWLADPANVGRSTDTKLLNRILTPSERLLVAVSPDSDFMLWSLWAAKEAAYKAWSRGRFAAPFSPVSFAVEFLPGKGQARVVKGQRTIGLRWTRGADWVHALASDAPDEVRVHIETTEVDVDASKAVRALAVRRLAEAGIGGASVEGLPPRFFVEGVALELGLSLSHDGPLIATAFEKPRLA